MWKHHVHACSAFLQQLCQRLKSYGQVFNLAAKEVDHSKEATEFIQVGMVWHTEDRLDLLWIGFHFIVADVEPRNPSSLKLTLKIKKKLK